MNVMDHTPLRDLLEDAEARGSVDADEMEAAIAGLDLTEEDEADLRRQLDELDVEVVAVRAAEPDIVEAQPRWYHTAATTNSLELSTNSASTFVQRILNTGVNRNITVFKTNVYLASKSNL